MRMKLTASTRSSSVLFVRVGFGMCAGLFGLTLGSRGRGARFDFELRGLS